MTRERPDRFDLIVIGAGGAGSTASGEAIGRGANVAMIERWLVGGTCLNAGCDPTKTLVRSAEVMHLVRQAERFGVQTCDPRANWPAVVERVAGVIDRIRGGDGEQNIRNHGITLIKGHARFRSPNVIEVNGDLIEGDKIIIATGAAERASIPGLSETGYITNVEAVALPSLPRSLVVIGGGVIACEFAQIFARFGVEVTIMGSREHLLPKEDPELTAPLRAILEREEIRVETGVRITRVERRGDRKCAIGLRHGEIVEVLGEEILLATGRQPVVDGLDLEAAGVAYGEKGIAVDDELRTTAPGIWAVGDVTGLVPFTHVADYQARIAEHNALSGMPPRRADYRVVPWVTFTDPELARVGLTESEARDGGHDVSCAVVQMHDIARALTSDQTDGLVKLIADRATGQILGGHILAAHGGELIAEVALAMRMRLPVSAIAETIHAYPTFAEAVFWAAFELAKPEDPAFAAVRGVQAPAGEG